MINKLFMRLALLYPYKWAAQFPTDDASVLMEAQRLWYENLKDLTLPHLNRGITICAKAADKFIPSPGEFRDRCLPSLEELGIPDIDDAWAMANNNDWKCPLVWHAVAAIRSFEFKRGTAQEMQDRFASVYCKLVQRARKGEQFMMPSNPQLPPPDKREFKKSEPETAEKHLENMRKILKTAKQLAGKKS